MVKAGARQMVVVGQNSSTANQEKAYKTVAMVEKVAARNGFGSFVLTKLYALRLTDLSGPPDAAGPDLMARNVEAVVGVAGAADTAIWAAWGNLISNRPDLAEALAKVPDQINGAQWLHFGALTVDGHTRHPRQASRS